MQGARGVQFVEIVCADVDTSAKWYEEHLGLVCVDGASPDVRWLDAGHAGIKLTAATPATRESGWDTNNLQRGIRHIGFKVADVDAHAERLREAGVVFRIDPKDATGGVRITFFDDPDGNRLELVENALEYHRTWSPELAERERATLPGPGDPPRFDHAAITVADLDESLRFYQDVLGFEVIGQLTMNDPRGFLITYLKGGAGGVELFSWGPPTLDNPAASGEKRLGFGAIGVGIDGEASSSIVEPDGVPLEVVDVR